MRGVYHRAGPMAGSGRTRWLIAPYRTCPSAPWEVRAAVEREWYKLATEPTIRGEQSQ
jgi:hypothetical protein